MSSHTSRPAKTAAPHQLVMGAIALAVAAACPAPALAQSNADLVNEIKALKERMVELEKKLDAQPAGMTPDQQQDFNRITVKTEALEDSRDASGLKGLKFSGYMDPTYVFNQRQHRGGFQFLNSVADGGYFYDNSYQGTVVLDLLKETDSGARWHLTLSPQRSSQGVAESSSSLVQEASVSVPLTDLQTRFIAGQIPDWSGYEMLQPTLNKLISHNLLFDTTLPATYTGAGLELTRNQWIVKGVLANMNASRRNKNEKTPVLAYRVDYAKGEFQGFGFAGVHGKAKNNAVTDGPDSRVDLFEADAYFIRGDLTAQTQLSWGRQRKAAITADADGNLRDAYWSGISALVAYKFQPWLEGIARIDHIWNKKNGGGLLTYTTSDDRNGIGPAWSQDDAGTWSQATPNKGVDRTALTFGLGYNFNLNTVFKVEYRLDKATGAAFIDTKDGSYKKNNQLLSTAVVVSF